MMDHAEIETRPDADNGAEATALQPVVGPVPPPLALTQGLVDADARSALATVDRRIAFYTEVRNRSVKLTLPQDWSDHSGKPYLGATGAERLKPLWGIYIRNLRIEPTLDEVRRHLRLGEHVSVQIIGTAGSRVTGEESEFLGGRSSDDPFFADQKGGIEEGVDPEDLVKAAVSNFEVNAITRLLGLRGLSWADLEPHGINAERSKAAGGGRASYRQGGQTASSSKLADMAAEIRQGLEAVFGGQALQSLKALSSFKAQDGSTKSIDTWAGLERASEKWVGSVLGKVRTEVETWTKQGRPAPKVPMEAQQTTPF
jgi:hypothetical protein